MNEAVIEADLVDFLRGGPINVLVLSEDEMKAANRLIERGAVRKTWRSGGHALLGVYHVELSK